jgi:hypothetical protein
MLFLCRAKRGMASLLAPSVNVTKLAKSIWFDGSAGAIVIPNDNTRRCDAT